MCHGIYFIINSLTEQEEAVARTVCLGSHATHGDYGDCDSASVARLGACGGRGGCSSARTMCGGGCGSARTMCGGGCGSARTMQRQVQLAPRNHLHLSIRAVPQILVIKWLPH